jgi:hypothetical protein
LILTEKVGVGEGEFGKVKRALVFYRVKKGRFRR